MAKLAISAGHTRGTGAAAINGEQEYEWNSEVIRHYVRIMKANGHKVTVFQRDGSLLYGRAMSKLAKEIKAEGCAMALELHFNSSSNPKANGYEFLHWWGSKKGRNLAQNLGLSFGRTFKAMHKRGNDDGARTLWFHQYNEGKGYSHRGAAYVYKTHCPAVICEPFFGSNSHHSYQIQPQPEKYAQL